MIPFLPRLSDYDVSAIHGFLPTDPPCDRLADPYYQPWEDVIYSLHTLTLTKRIRPTIDRLPVLSTKYLRTVAEWRRAYSVLGFMVHSYVWGGYTPADKVPPPISIPFLAVCDHLEVKPVASYAGLVLWNWAPLVISEPIDSLDNIAMLHTFHGSMDEVWFYMISVAIEARGAPLIPLMLEAVSAARYNDSETVIQCLRTFAERLDELGSLLTRMYENCDPQIFYNRIRPFLAGGKNMADAGLPNGIVFDTGSSADAYVQYSGGSNAQSSIIQFFDLILGIEHRPTGERTSTSSASDSEGQGQPPTNAPKAYSGYSHHNFILEMRKYMPGPHRRFLEHVERVANIRPYVFERRDNRALSTAFDACLAMLRAFRDKHIQMVSRYIIVPARDARRGRSLTPQSQAQSQSHPSSESQSPLHTTPLPSVQPKKLNLAVASSEIQDPRFFPAAGGTKRRLRGTGGTALIPFLKQARDETGEPAIDEWARRLLNNGPGPAEMGALRVDGPALQSARLTKMGEHADGVSEIVGLAGVWSVDDSEGGICHW